MKDLLQKSHRQEACPSTPSISDNTPAAIKAENALEIKLPQKRTAFLFVSSRRVYHFERISNAPGRKAASVKPRKKRITTIPVKLWTFPERVEIRPQRSMIAPRYNEGRWILLMNMLEGTC